MVVYVISEVSATAAGTFTGTSVVHAETGVTYINRVATPTA
jgi:hypothetical protein